jgi:hypothetical protein
MGAAAGAAASGTIAGAMGASTLFGSTSLASSILGTVFVTSTPVGWVVGSAVAAGALGLGIAKACSSGGKNDYIRQKWKKVLEQKAARTSRSDHYAIDESDLTSVLREATEAGRISRERSEQILDLVKRGHWSVEAAAKRIRDLNGDAISPKETGNEKA